MDAPLRPRERIALATVLLIGLVVIAWLAWPAPAAPLQPLRWDDIAPAQDAALRPWRWIVIHHSATPGGTAEGIDREHRQRGWEGVGYHLLIGNGRGTAEGRIEATFRWRRQEQGAHAGAKPAQKPYNEAGIGLCLIGDYRDRGPSPIMESRLVELCALLIRRYPTLAPERIIGHGEVPEKATQCPGEAVDMARIRRLVAARLAEPR